MEAQVIEPAATPEGVRLVERACPSCGEGNEATAPGPYSVGVWSVKTCRGCGLTYIDKAPDYEALFAEMSWEKTSKAESERRNATRRVQQAISKGTRWRLHMLPRKNMPDLLARYAEPGNVVDLGCGNGGQLKGLDAAFVPHGVEISTALAEKADARFAARGGYAVNAPSLEGLRTFPDDYFSAASLRSYLEHELHPAPVLRALHRTLRPGGIAIVKVPNFGSLNRRLQGLRWCGFRHPDHLNYFTPATLADLARRCGYRTWFGLTWRLPTSDNMYALLRKV